MNKFKKGDVVIVRDSSYAKVVTEHGTEHSNRGGRYEIRNERCIIIQTNCIFPNPNKYQSQYGHVNNTVIRVIKTGDVAFIEERFLIPAIHTITIDGKTIELSHESFLNLKEQFV